ncbi:MAG: glycosyltransferase [Candidatus Uhrbacteria bacterium]
MIRLTHIMTSFDIGGAEQLVLDICRRLDRKRFEVTVVAVVRGGPMRAEFHDAGVHTEVIGKRTKLGLDTIRKLSAFLRSPKSDIVHTHLFGGDTWGRIAARRVGVQHIVSTEHNVNLDEGFVKRFVKRRLARRTDRIIAVSDAVRSYSIRYDRVPLGKMLVIPNGVDASYFQSSAALPRYGVRLLTVGRLVHQKGHAVLIDALSLLRARCPQVSLDIVGDGPLRASLEQQVRAYHLSDIVRFHGFRRDVRDFYQRADIVVLPSRWEGFGIAAIEASACSVPVVASAVGGLLEAIIDQETGILVPVGDAKLLAEALSDLVADRTQRVLMGHAGRRHVIRNFDIVRVVERYAALYEELMSISHRRGEHAEAAG